MCFPGICKWLRPGWRAPASTAMASLVPPSWLLPQRRAWQLEGCWLQMDQKMLEHMPALGISHRRGYFTLVLTKGIRWLVQLKQIRVDERVNQNESVNDVQGASALKFHSHIGLLQIGWMGEGLLASTTHPHYFEFESSKNFALLRGSPSAKSSTNPIQMFSSSRPPGSFSCWEKASRVSSPWALGRS